MTARIRPAKVDSMSVGFSTHHPRFERQYKQPETPEDIAATAALKLDAQASGLEASNLLPPDDSLPPETLFEVARLAGETSGRALTPLEIAIKLQRDWKPPVGGFALADKSI